MTQDAPPLFGFWADEGAFREHPLVGFDRHRMPVQPALTAAVVAKRHRDSIGFTGRRTWFAGRPVAPAAWEWPRREDGTPLTHVLQLDLDTAAADNGKAPLRELDLPPHGVLSIFHDLASYGDDESDHDAWAVHWTSRKGDGKPVLHEVPADVEPSKHGAAVPLHTEISPTIPNPVEFSGSRAERERYLAAWHWIQAYPRLHNVEGRRRDAVTTSPWERDFELTEMPSRFRGFPLHERDDDLWRTMRNARGSNGDDFVMLADINPADAGQREWFHGGHHLEVWIRHSDLAARRFDRAWCGIRVG